MRIRYNDPQFFAIFGGAQAMIESPLLQEIVERTRQEATMESLHKAIVRILRTRFGGIPEEVMTAVNKVADPQTVDQLFKFAVISLDHNSFQQRMSS